MINGLNEWLTGWPMTAASVVDPDSSRCDSPTDTQNTPSALAFALAASNSFAEFVKMCDGGSLLTRT